MATARSRKWPTAAELKYNPANWETNSKSGGVRSDVADLDGNRNWPGWDTQPAPFVKQHELADWTGGFGAPPVSWDYRPPYEDSDMTSTILKWLQDIKDGATDSCNGFFQTPKNVLLDLGEGTKYDICPTDWLPEKIENQDPPTWWANHLQDLLDDDSPEFYEIDNSIAPFWDRWMDSHKERLSPIEVPETFVDPNDEISRKKHRQTSLDSANRFVRYRKDRSARLRVAKEERRQRQLDREYGERQTADSLSAINMYLRPAETRDLAQIRDIYNHRVLETVDVPELRPVTLEVMGERWADIVDVNLPFLVAAARSSKGKRRQGRRPSDPGHHEQIIGFAFADDYNSPEGMYRYTVEVECYVHSESLRLRVGSALMDRLLCALDPYYAGLGGYDFVGDETRYSGGGKRVVENIAAHVTLPTDDRAKLAWCEPWLEKMGFEKKGEYPSAGRKLNKIVDLITYWKKTGSDIPNIPP